MNEDSLVKVNRNPKRENWLVWWPDHVKPRCGWGLRVSWTRDSRQHWSAVIFCQLQGLTSVWMLAHSFRFFQTMEPHPSIWTKDRGDALFSDCKNVISWLLHFPFETFSSNFKTESCAHTPFWVLGLAASAKPREWGKRVALSKWGGCQRSCLNIRTEAPSMSSIVFLAISAFSFG